MVRNGKVKFSEESKLPKMGFLTPITSISQFPFQPKISLDLSVTPPSVPIKKKFSTVNKTKLSIIDTYYSPNPK